MKGTVHILNDNLTNTTPSIVDLDSRVVPVNNLDNSPDVNVNVNFDFNDFNDTFKCNKENYNEDIKPNNKNKDNFNNVNTINSYISYYYTNIDQLAIKSTNKMEELKLIVSDEKPDLIGITEILSKNNKDFTPAELKLTGYDCFYTEDTFERGTVLYVKKSLNGCKFNEFDDIGFKESTWASFRTVNDEKILVGCIYRRGKSTEENLNNLKLIMNSKKLNTFDRVLIAGDFNFPNIDWQNGTSSDHLGEIFLEAINNAYLVQHVNKPTRIKNDQKRNILDLVLTKNVEDIQHIDYCSAVGLSDHLLLKILTSIPKNIHQNKINTKFDFNKGNYTDFNIFIQEDNWEYLNFTDVEEGWNKLKNKVLSGMEEFVPKVNLNKKKSKPPWMTSDIKKSIKTKYKLFKRFLESKNSFHYKQYIQIRNEVSKKLKNLKREHEKKIAEDCKVNPKAFWHFINSKRKCKIGITSLIKADGTYTKNDKEKAEVLDNLFSSVFTKENKNNIPNTIPGEKSENTFLSDIIITEKAVLDKLNNLNTNKTPGADNIHPRVLKELSMSLSKPLTYLFNKSINDGQLPTDWKTANVSAIFKKGEKSDANNYRPVSLTSIVCKILESIIRDVLQNFFENQNLYSSCQHGFRKDKSCTSQLLEVMEDFTTFIDNNDTFDVIYLDFKKAFDTVPHIRLLNKLKSYGIDGNILSWIESFLTNRTQKVRVGEEQSKISPVISGIPQGSILGPILFTIFINDLPECVSGFCKIFADDTKVYNKSTEFQQIQEDLNKVEEWSNKWQLHFNISKCKCLYYGKNNPNNIYYLNGQEINSCNQEKDLGIYFDPDLNFKSHIFNITKKANQVMGIIKRNFNYIDTNVFTKLYKALVRPHLEYGQSVWSPHLIFLSKEIEKVQRRATKQIPTFKNLSYETRMIKLNLPSLKYRRIRGDLIQVYKIIQSKNYQMFTPCQNSTRGHNFKLLKNYNRLEVRKNSFSHRIVNRWNALSYETVNSKNINDFKKRLDEDLKDCRYLYDD